MGLPFATFCAGGRKRMGLPTALLALDGTCWLKLLKTMGTHYNRLNGKQYAATALEFVRPWRCMPL